MFILKQSYYHIIAMFGFWKIERKIREKENRGKVKEKQKLKKNKK